MRQIRKLPEEMRESMMSHPSQEDLEKVLAAAGTAHHEFEQNFLGGSRDEQWSAWYAAYVLGRLGDFVSPSVLTRWLESAPAGAEWSANAASFVVRHLSAV